jgi:Thioredoxin domain
VLLAYRCALASERVKATAIEANEFPQLAQELEVWAVPRIVVDGEPRSAGSAAGKTGGARRTAWDGAVPEPEFLRRILAA